MAIITHKIGSAGTGRDFPTPVEWFAAIPTDVVGSGNSYVGEMYNDSEIVTTAPITFNGKTTDATHGITLQYAPGHGWTDNPNVLTNAAAYNPANGVAIRCTANYSDAVVLRQAYMAIIGIQIRNTGNGAATRALEADGGNAGMRVERNLLSLTGGTCPHVVKMSNGIFRNNFVVQAGGGNLGMSIAYPYANLVIDGNTFIRPSNMSAGANAITKEGGLGAVISNNAFLNYTSAIDLTTSVTGSNNVCTGTVSFGTSNIENVVLVNQVISAVFSTLDLRTKAGAALIDAGVAVSGNTTTVNGPRTRGLVQDAGAWEYVAAASDTIAPVLSGPTATPTSGTTVTGTVGTDEGGGVLYYLVSANATETAATIKASGATQAVTATGQRTVFVTGQTAGTTRYLHFVQTDAASTPNTSNVVSVSFTMPAADTVAPTFAGGSAISPGAITSSTLAFTYPAATDNVGVAKYQTSKDSGANWQDNGTGLSGSFSGLTAGATYPIWVRAVDAQNNPSTPLQTTMTTSAAATGTFVGGQVGSAGTLRANQAFTAEWHQGGVPGTNTGTVSYYSGTLSSTGVPTLLNVPKGTGYAIIVVGPCIAYQAGTVA